MVSNDKIVWIDCEMTGLDEVRDELIEVAAVITDFDLNPLDEGIDIVIKPSAAALENMNDFVTKMHTSSGLITELDAGTTVAEAQTQVLEYIKKHVPEAGKAPLGGNSVGTDKVFLNKQMPELVEHLHYRIIDVSSIKELSKQWFPRAYFQSPEKHGGHRALGDILDSIVELQYYRKAVFSAEGPTSEEAKSIAAEVSASITR
ncbi:oligoribonuclease [Brevibacterium aurantiacum]|uniref:Oligoribonuclease n=2 Tax=Brevibacterium aurantiacum TaxID=273384 RepID=A0A2A3X0K9_BREAU|nr:oligoribonuclease [Brevibacterium aurantiacum]AZL10004.1 oligoribonuclease [Brevibacterium aurantiacum]AZT94166.1 oligoribonuclease [Brevibacterium aurantiacum]AZT97976.1 oligoribonuclease [Brevibacterium aurantiacum]PCC17241.1 oligoribonuclease [Brevibacterium aurantiacum]